MSACKLVGKIAVITGASSGIGRSTAISFAKEGAKVVLLARREKKLQEVASTIRAAGGQAEIVVGDVCKEEHCKRAVDTAVEAFGGLHVAFNNAGMSNAGTFADASTDEVVKVFNTNLTSIVLCLKHQIPAMAKSTDKGSIIINTSCTGSRVFVNGLDPGHNGVYAASKAGADMLMKYAAIEGAASGIRVNSVAPGVTDTEMIDPYPREFMEGFARETQVLGRLIKPEEVANVVTFLASDDAAMVTGSIYAVDGGFTAIA